jgi:hypothetical protein
MGLLRLSMSFKDYLEFLTKFSNAPLTLNRLTLPFGIISDSEPSHTLLVGHILEDLSMRIESSQCIDPIDVLTSAHDLGHEPASAFLEEIPYIIAKMSEELGMTRLH